MPPRTPSAASSGSSARPRSSRIGELYLSPIGLSFVTKVAPVRIVSMMMGVWFLANFIGNYMTGYLGTFYEKIRTSSSS